MNCFQSYGFMGSHFIVFGVWHLIQICRRYNNCRRRGIRYKSSTAYHCDCLCIPVRDHPVESFVNIAILLCGISLEIVSVTKDGWNESGLQHAKMATIYFFFAVSGLVDVLNHYLAFAVFRLDYLCWMFSFFLEWILFRFPDGARTPLEDLLQRLLEYVIFITISIVAMEMQCRALAIPAVVRSYFMLLQGTWLWQCAFILWKPYFGLPWQHHDKGDQLLACLFFAWHCGGNLMLVVAISGIVAFIYQGKSLLVQQKKDEVQMKSLIKPKKNGQTIISLGSYDDDDDDDDADEDSDIEFQRRSK